MLKLPGAAGTPNADGDGDQVRGRGSAGFCGFVGVALLIVGGYFLLNPEEEHSSLANLQRLAIGMTASIVGAIFLACAVRPR
jgi:hypothetical protein